MSSSGAHHFAVEKRRANRRGQGSGTTEYRRGTGSAESMADSTITVATIPPVESTRVQPPAAGALAPERMARNRSRLRLPGIGTATHAVRDGERNSRATCTRCALVAGIGAGGEHFLVARQLPLDTKTGPAYQAAGWNHNSAQASCATKR